MNSANQERWKAYAQGIAAGLQEPSIQLPALLLRCYRALDISDSELLLLLQIMGFKQAEQNEFPTSDELADRLDRSSSEIMEMLSRLIRDGLLSIEDVIDPFTEIHSERYNWEGLLVKAARWKADQKLLEAQELSRRRQEAETARALEEEQAGVEHTTDANTTSSLFESFEQEFGRLLSPYECETIVEWLDRDRYDEELIRFALKEAVFANKLSLRYIDRILIEWSRNRVTNVDEARAQVRKHRSR